MYIFIVYKYSLESEKKHQTKHSVWPIQSKTESNKPQVESWTGHFQINCDIWQGTLMKKGLLIYFRNNLAFQNQIRFLSIIQWRHFWWGPRRVGDMSPPLFQYLVPSKLNFWKSISQKNLCTTAPTTLNPELAHQSMLCQLYPLLAFFWKMTPNAISSSIK